MLNVSSNGAIKMTRGDTARLTVAITKELDGSAYTMEPADTLTLTVKKFVNDREAQLQKTVTGSGLFSIEPADTAGLPFGRYQYDVQLTTAAGDVYTVIGPACFEILKEVTW